MADKPIKNRGLGRGLSALLSDVSPKEDSASADADRREVSLPIDRLHPNPDQPRRAFDPQALEDLAASIAEKGVIQPLIVRKDPNRDGHYEIVAGERRWRASQVAGLHQVPVLVRDFSDSEVLEVAIIENIQRADLNAIDEAAAYRQLMDRFGHTQEQIATGLGKSRSHIANLLRLLTLPNDVQALVTDGRLSAGHARALVGAENPMALARQIIVKGLSVRQTESLAKKASSKAEKADKKSKPHTERDADTIAIENELAATLKMGVSIKHESGKESGEITLRYRNLDQLDDLLRLLSGG
jgi:ParB family chromosome partitioning protein